MQRQPAQVETGCVKGGGGDFSDFEWLLVSGGLVFLTVLIYWGFHPKASLEFTESDLSGSSLG